MIDLFADVPTVLRLKMDKLIEKIPDLIWGFLGCRWCLAELPIEIYCRINCPLSSLACSSDIWTVGIRSWNQSWVFVAIVDEWMLWMRFCFHWDDLWQVFCGSFPHSLKFGRLRSGLSVGTCTYKIFKLHFLNLRFSEERFKILSCLRAGSFLGKLSVIRIRDVVIRIQIRITA